MEQKESNSIKHFTISLIKSITRIVSCVFLCYGNYLIAGIGLGVAEILGILEEL